MLDHVGHVGEQQPAGDASAARGRRAGRRDAEQARTPAITPTATIAGHSDGVGPGHRAVAGADVGADEVEVELALRPVTVTHVRNADRIVAAAPASTSTRAITDEALPVQPVGSGTNMPTPAAPSAGGGLR